MSNLNSFSLINRLHRCFAIFEKSLVNRLQKPARPRKLLTPLTLMGGGSFSITSILAWLTSIPLAEILWPRTMPSITIKWHFYNFKTRFVLIHLSMTLFNRSRLQSNEGPNIENLTINTSMEFSIMLEKIESMHIWNVVRALHNLKNILRYTTTLNRHENVSFSWSPGSKVIWLYA